MYATSILQSLDLSYKEMSDVVNRYWSASKLDLRVHLTPLRINNSSKGNKSLRGIIIQNE